MERTNPFKTKKIYKYVKTIRISETEKTKLEEIKKKYGNILAHICRCAINNFEV